MRKFISLALVLILCVSLFSGCGKTKSEKLLDKYSEIANHYTALSTAVSASDSYSNSGEFSNLGAKLTDFATRLAVDGDSMTDEDLEKISASLDVIKEKLSEIEQKVALKAE